MFVICCIRSFMLHARVIYSCVRAFVRDLILKTTAAVATTAVTAAAVSATAITATAGSRHGRRSKTSTTHTAAPRCISRLDVDQAEPHQHHGEEQ